MNILCLFIAISACSGGIAPGEAHAAEPELLLAQHVFGIERPFGEDRPFGERRTIPLIHLQSSAATGTAGSVSRPSGDETAEAPPLSEALATIDETWAALDTRSYGKLPALVARMLKQYHNASESQQERALRPLLIELARDLRRKGRNDETNALLKRMFTNVVLARHYVEDSPDQHRTEEKRVKESIAHIQQEKPAVQVDVLLDAATFYQVTQPAKTEDYLRRAVHIAKEHAMGELAQPVRALYYFYTRTRQRSKAAEFLSEVGSALAAQPGTYAVLGELAQNAIYSGYWNQSRDLTALALRNLHNYESDSGAQELILINSLAAACSVAGANEERERFAQLVLERAGEDLQGDGDRYAASMLGIALWKVADKKFEEANELKEKAVAALGEQPPEIWRSLAALERLAYGFEGTGCIEGAEGCYETAATLSSGVAPVDPYDLAQKYLLLAKVQSRHSHAKARKSLEAAARVLERAGLPGILNAELKRCEEAIRANEALCDQMVVLNSLWVRGKELRNSVSLQPYVLQAVAQIKEQMSGKGLDVEGRAEAIFDVTKDGAIVNCRLKRLSGDRDRDRDIVLAIKNASPLPGLPDGVSYLKDVHCSLGASAFGKDAAGD